jgi:hypothetical protein
MNQIAFLLLALACSLSMGLCMWLMRPRKSAKQDSRSANDERDA